jgi:type VI protein secretion system component VasK
MAVADPGILPQSRRRPASLLNDPAEADLLGRRLQHLCRLIVRSRRPYCPINGILFLIPYAATETASEADEIGAICQRDRAAAREVLQVHCPAFAMICDVEEVPGFRTFIAHFPEEQREKVLGLDLPLIPVLDESAFAVMINGGVRWIDQVLIPTLVYRLWRVEEPDHKGTSDLLRENIQLYQVLSQLHQRRDRIVRALTRTLANETPGTALFGGCYLAATGRDASREQAFVVGVFRRLLENQNFVTWTAEALAEDADYRRWAFIGWVGIVFTLVMVVSLGYVSWVR